ncbi:MAG: hypothetical protein LLG20_18405 [Acidobacteriales bacterium]|nr:hypothetical protein [Terriglobales bacterium]
MAGLKWDFNASTLLAVLAALVTGALWIQAQTTVEPLKNQYSEVLTEVRALRKDVQDLSLKVERAQVKLEDGRRTGVR